MRKTLHDKWGEDEITILPPKKDEEKEQDDEAEDGQTDRQSKE